MRVTKTRKHLAILLLCLLLLALSFLLHDILKAGDLREEIAKEVIHHRFAAHVFKDSSGGELPYRLLSPKNYRANRAYPLLLYLHGSGDSGTDNKKQLYVSAYRFGTREMREKYPCFVVVPQCPPDDSWVNEDWSKIHVSMPTAPSKPMQAIVQLLAALRNKYNIDPERIYVTGFSMGGCGAWDLLARYPNLFAAAAPVCGAADASTAPRIAHIPLWIFQGEADPIIKVENVRKMVAALRKAGGNPKYTEYAKVGHWEWVPAYNNPELYEWLFEQRKRKR